MSSRTARRPSRLTVTLVLLTVTTGVIEAVSFLGLGHVFTATMTGNVLFVGFGLAGEDLSALGSTVSLVAFALGAVAGHRMNARVSLRCGRRWLAVALGAEGVLLLAAAALALGLDGAVPRQLTVRHLVVIAVLAIAMGSRNATALRVAAPDLPTTLATRSLTGLFMLPNVHQANVPEAAARRFAAVAAMLAGAVAGALLLTLHPTVPLLVAAAAEFAIGATCPAPASSSDRSS